MQIAPLARSMALNCRGGSPSAVHSMDLSRLLWVTTRWREPGNDSMSGKGALGGGGAKGVPWGIEKGEPGVSRPNRKCQLADNDNVQKHKPASPTPMLSTLPGLVRSASSIQFLLRQLPAWGPSSLSIQVQYKQPPPPQHTQIPPVYTHTVCLFQYSILCSTNDPPDNRLLMYLDQCLHALTAYLLTHTHARTCPCSP